MKNHSKTRNILLFGVLMATILFSSLATIHRLEDRTAAVSLPIVSSAAEFSALEAFLQERDTAYASDAAALQRLCETESLDASSRESAARQLQEMIDRRERQTALEGSLSQSGISPCAAIITGNSVTIVTEKPTLTDGERALILTLAKTHADIPPSGVQVITGETK